mmetsp:Transcript_44298/g.110933  ORF Transcript_44298/g.110933 Transcript_44298/m.110933 type:complete len:445 (+) Transcript_44298:215-1549(+)
MRILLPIALALLAPSPSGSFQSSPAPLRAQRPGHPPATCRAPAQGLGQLGLLGRCPAASPATPRRMQDGPPSAAAGDVKQREFELARGKAVDTLLTDYDSLFVAPSDYSIFHNRIILRDVQGFTLEGLKSYKLFFKTVKNLISLLFTSPQVSVVLMDKYGTDKSKIKLRWRMELNSRGLSWGQAWGWLDRNGDGVISEAEVAKLGEKKEASKSATTWTKAVDQQNKLVIEGISEYKLDAQGSVYEHVITISYPASPWSLEPLRELLPVRRASPGLAGVAGGYGVVSSSLEESRPLADAHPELQPVLQVSSVPTSPLDALSPAQTCLAHETPAPAQAPTASLDLTAGGAAVMRADEEKGGLLGGFMSALMPEKFGGKTPKQCKEDYDCNPGGYNFPLICADFVVARFCIDPDDWSGGGLGALAWDETTELAKEPIPVRVDDGHLS